VQRSCLLGCRIDDAENAEDRLSRKGGPASYETGHSLGIAACSGQLPAVEPGPDRQRPASDVVGEGDPGLRGSIDAVHEGVLLEIAPAAYEKAGLEGRNDPTWC
jgi:hypothetical protein